MPRHESRATHGTKSARWYLDEAFRLLGGVDAFGKWAKQNPNEFYPLYVKARVARPLPEAEDEGDQRVTIVIQASTSSSAPQLSAPDACKQERQADAQAEEK